MGRESAGSVFVTIDGDAGPLLAKYAQAEAQSRAAGQRIASGLGAGLSSATGIVDQFGRAIESSITKPVAKAAPVLQDFSKIGSQLARSLGEVAGAAEATEAGLASVGNAAAQAEQKAMSFVGVIPGLGRAAEHFINLLPGVGTAIMAAFPVLGAIALIENLKGMGTAVMKAAENFLFLKDAEEEAMRVGKEFASDTEQAVNHIRQLQVEALREQGRAIEAAQLERKNLGDKFIHLPGLDDDKLSGLATDDIAKLKSAFANVLPADLGDRIFQVKQNLADVTTLWENARQNALPLDPFGKHIESQAATAMQLYGNALQFLQTKRDEFDAEQKAATAKVGKVETDEAKKQASEWKQVLDKRIAAFRAGWAEILADRRAFGDEMSKQEELTFLGNQRAAAQANGPGFQPVVTEITKQIGNLQQAQLRDNAKAEKELKDSLAKAELTYQKDRRHDLLRDLEVGGQEMDAAIRKASEEEQRTRQEAARAAQVGDRAARQTNNSATSIANANGRVQALQLELTYEQQVIHSRREQIEQARQLAAIEAKTAQDNILSAQADVAIARATLQQTPNAQTLLALQQAQTKEAEAEARAKETQLKTQARLTAMQRDASLAGQIQSAVGKGPGSLLDARNVVIANTMGSAVNGIAGALGRAVQGGQKLSQIFVQLGKSVLGEVVAGIAKIGLQMVTTAIMGKSIGSAIAVAEVTSAAAVGAANAAASTAAIPIIGPALAPAAAAATFAEIMAFAPLAAFDKGGWIDQDQIARVHKGEFVLTADQMSGRAPLPDLPSTGAISAHGISSGSSHNSHSMSIGSIILQGMNNPEAFARALPRIMKSRAPNFSPASR